MFDVDESRPRADNLGEGSQAGLGRPRQRSPHNKGRSIKMVTPVDV
jgi:hypothetical protein